MPPPPLLDLSIATVYSQPFNSLDEWLWATDGSRLAYRGGPYRKFRLEVVDVVTGEKLIVPGSRADFVGLEAFEGDTIIGLKSRVRSSPGEDATPGGNQNANRWQIVRYELSTGESSLVDAGVNRWVIDDSYVHDPVVSVDGDLIAYSTELSRSPGRAEIIVRSLANGTVVRRITTTRPVFELELLGQDVTYVTGDVGEWPPWDGPENPERVLSPATGPERVVPYEQDHDTHENGVTVSTIDGGSDEHGFYEWVTATVDGLVRPIGIWNRSGITVHGDGFVVWVAGYSVGGTYMDTEGVTVFDTVSGEVLLLDRSVEGEYNIGEVVGIDDGWLIWTTWNSDDEINPDGSIPRTLHAVRTVDITGAFEALGDL